MRPSLLATALSRLAALQLAACCQSVPPSPPAPSVNWDSLRPPPTVDAGPPHITTSEQRLAQEYTAALASPEFDLLGPLLSDDPHWAFPGQNDAQGRQAVVRAHELLFGAFRGRTFTIDRVWRTPNEQTIEWTMSGLQERDWMSAPASHRQARFKGLTLLWTRDDGTIADVHVYFDVAVVKVALGAGPKGLAGLPEPMAAADPQVYEQPDSGDLGSLGVVTTSLDALGNHKLDVYLGAMTDDVEIWTLERAQPGRGRRAASAYLAAMNQAIGQLDVTVTHGWSVGSFAIVEYSMSGLQRGPIGWVPAQQDNVIALKVADVCEMRAGKIARIWRYDNPAQLTMPQP
jgi:ketosteroid isomerase-like protein